MYRKLIYCLLVFLFWLLPVPPRSLWFLRSLAPPRSPFPSLPPFPPVFRGACPSGPSGSFPFIPLFLSLLSVPPSISTEWPPHRH